MNLISFVIKLYTCIHLCAWEMFKYCMFGWSVFSSAVVIQILGLKPGGILQDYLREVFEGSDVGLGVLDHQI